MSFYDILGVSPTASVTEIRKSYRRQALRWHPDKNQDNLEEASKKFRDISEAYEVLSDPEKRNRYDLNLSGGINSSNDEWRSNFAFRNPEDIFRDFFAFFDNMELFSTNFRDSDASNFGEYHHTSIFSSQSSDEGLGENMRLPDVPINRGLTRESRAVTYQNGNKVEKHSIFRNGHEVQEVRINDMLVSREIDGVDQEVPELPTTSTAKRQKP